MKARAHTLRIYTRTGDRGETSLRLGQRVPKDAVRVEAYGAVDEVNSFLGLALSLLPIPDGSEPAPPGTEPARAGPPAKPGPDPATAAGLLADLHAAIRRIQRELFDVGADLATPPDRSKGEAPRVSAEMVTQLEQDIDALDARLPELRHFILPGGSPAAAALQVARTVCRRAERRAVTLGRHEAVDPVLLQYLNRLSDFLFVAARAANRALGIEEPRVTWKTR